MRGSLSRAELHAERLARRRARRDARHEARAVDVASAHTEAEVVYVSTYNIYNNNKRKTKKEGKEKEIFYMVHIRRKKRSSLKTINLFNSATMDCALYDRTIHALVHMPREIGLVGLYLMFSPHTSRHLAHRSFVLNSLQVSCPLSL